MADEPQAEASCEPGLLADKVRRPVRAEREAVGPTFKYIDYILYNLL